MHPGHYCAQDPKNMSDSCQGDSGGPLQIFLENSSIATIVGIVSLEPSCGTAYPGIYSRVAYYLNWIEAVAWENQPLDLT